MNCPTMYRRGGAWGDVDGEIWTVLGSSRTGQNMVL